VPPFPKPTFAYDYQVDAQVKALRDYERTKLGRSIPDKQADNLLLATWNIANLGVQERRDKDYRLIAEILSWFDVVAVQESHDNLAGIQAIHKLMPNSFRLLFSDASGNDERLTFLYDGTKVALLEEVGEVAPPPSDYHNVTIPGSQQTFNGFDRNPYWPPSRRTPSRSLW
jgi:hypothetical protein